MPRSRVARLADAQVAAALAQVRAELGIPTEFAAAAADEAATAARTGPLDVPGRSVARVDATDLPLLTIDPTGSMDLDQALHVAPAGDGWTVHYAIADVGAFVVPGGALDTETHARGTTCYGPDGTVPLHPTSLSEGAASLLPDQERPAVLWRFDLGADGEPAAVHVGPATVRSRAQLAYPQAQRMLDEHEPGPLTDVLVGVRAVGRLRERAERDRGGVSLSVPEQQVAADGHGGWTTSFRAVLPMERWNSQLSLLTGMAAARLMLDAGVGLLRTMPPADDRDVARLHRTAAALDVDWPADEPYPHLLRRLDSAHPAEAAFLDAATSLFRGAGYVAFGGSDGAAPPTGSAARHAAIAAPYAHVTAPLRRLADRYASEIAIAACAGSAVPEWVRAALPALPSVMGRTGQRAAAYDREGTDVVEAAVLAPRVGGTFDGVVVDRRDAEPTRGELVVRHPAVRARIEADDGADLPLGVPVHARLAEASVPRRTVLFRLP
ncbi:RNB domain-containing ribonuclease [Cellulomonas sp. NTE-D12]|uniref:RNB domain-containing ribonuclease n=1 Tax=Cellulomonas sp. NTE-D12 TaxID=2962632 RepID=UPI00308178CB|nr:ribonuclease R [Cellulomonas sp. NTE-D12]